MSLEIKEVKTQHELKAFVRFPNQLYKGHPNYVPVIESQEIKTLVPSKNPAAKDCKTALWLAYRDGKIVGRIAGIINPDFFYKWGKNYARFGWMDFIEDFEVASALIETVENWAIENGVEAINGPLGFTDFDPEGVLVEGFDKKATIIERYNHPYYGKFLEDLGYSKHADWVEYEVKIPGEIPDKVKRTAEFVMSRYNLKVKKIRKISEVLPYIDQVFEIINNIYGLIYGFVPITKEISNFYLTRFAPLIDLDMVSIITDNQDKVVAFAVTMPSYTEVFQKANGSALKLRWLLLKGEHRKTHTADMYFIGVRPDFINKGVSAALFYEIGKSIIQKGFTKAETNLEYESNFAVQSLWNHFEHRQHKRRRCYLKFFISSTRTDDDI
ncbi:MAG: hypothetical protein HPY80_07145 [Bacteroidales bacterium]|jgi:hypothetical protein|nr:GNAT family N-acetyltransferase [Bacteroidales bacterium]NPV36428.1 hypothetical protein [Bacteroidales bacterium]